MKRLLNHLFIFLAFLLYFPFAYADTKIYKIDPMHSYVLWSTTHVGYSVQFGKFVMVNGTITADETKPENSKVTVTINTSDVVTGIPKLDNHLKSDEFFNVKTYPNAAFVSNKIVVTGKDAGKIYGNLTLLGVTKPVTLDVKLLKTGVHPITNKQSIGFNATAKIKRSDFGMNRFVPAVGDEIKLDIGVEAALEKP